MRFGRGVSRFELTMVNRKVDDGDRALGAVREMLGEALKVQGSER